MSKLYCSLFVSADADNRDDYSENRAYGDDSLCVHRQHLEDAAQLAKHQVKITVSVDAYQNYP